jgi:hypothetical protein
MANNTIPSKQHSISLERAKEMTRRFREQKDSVLNREVLGKDILPTCETFNKDAFMPFFENPAVKAIRIYYGMSEGLQIHAIIVGVNEKNEDMLPLQEMASTETTTNITDGVTTDLIASTTNTTDPKDPNPIIEDADRCPPTCPRPSPLIEP